MLFGDDVQYRVGDKLQLGVKGNYCEIGTVLAIQGNNITVQWDDGETNQYHFETIDRNCILLNTKPKLRRKQRISL